MSRRRGIIALTAVGFAIVVWLSGSGVDLDRSIPVEPGDQLEVAMTLGWGLSSDKGSLTVTSHDRDEVRVVVDTTGWGRYGVEVDVAAVPGGVEVRGRVDGFLHWMFSGPTVDIKIWVPTDYAIKASIEGGPLLIEDVMGPIVARTTSSELTLRRAEGSIKLIASGGPVVVEDIDGSLDIEVDDVDIDVSGVRGDLRIRSRGGHIEVSSVTGSIDLATTRGEIEIDDVEGNARVVSKRGSIDIEGLEGDLRVETDRGRIEVDEFEGRILARSGRGGIDVHFLSAPSGVIETDRGSIELEVPEGASFDLDALTARGSVELDSDLDFEHVASASKNTIEIVQGVAGQIAAEVTARVNENVQRGLETGNWDLDIEQRLRDARARRRGAPDGENADDAARSHGWVDHGWGDWRANHGPFGDRSVHIVGAINGGGAPLQLRTGRGSIEIDDR